MRYAPPNRENGPLEDVMTAMKAAPTQKYFVRLQAIRFLLLGHSPAEVSYIVLRSRPTIRRWIAAWNGGGVHALLPRPVPGRPQAVSDGDKERIIRLLEHPESAGESHWTARKIHGYISKKWSIKLGYSTLARSFRSWGFRLKVPRPWPLQQDEEAREAFRQELSQLLENKNLEVWFCDETGILGDPRPRRRWIKKGEKAKVPFSGLHLRSNVIGAVHPRSGEFFSLIVPYMDRTVFQVFLDELARETRGRKVVMVLDNASWHKVKSLNWHHVKPKFLPPYSPDLNPIERLWLTLKAQYFTDWIAKNQDQLDARVDQALKSFIFDQRKTASICRT